jgi:hypothetical protein
MKSFILSEKFPLFFIRSCSIIVLFLLFVVLALINKFDFCGGYIHLIYAKELLFSAAGVGSIGICTYFCLNSKL